VKNGARKVRGTPADAPDRRRLPLLLRRAWFNLNQTFRRRLSPLGITPDQFTVLRTLTEAGGAGLSQREVAELMSSDPNTIAALVERMESGGLIERAPDERDRRANRIKVKPAGRRIFEEARLVALALQTEVLSVLPEAGREEFLENLHQVAEACRCAAGKDPL
jgi:DNA-binding MarR family transcriptional regulator